jgi:hypothetical protein
VGWGLTRGGMGLKIKTLACKCLMYRLFGWPSYHSVIRLNGTWDGDLRRSELSRSCSWPKSDLALQYSIHILSALLPDEPPTILWNSWSLIALTENWKDGFLTNIDLIYYRIEATVDQKLRNHHGYRHRYILCWFQRFKVFSPSNYTTNHERKQQR